MEKRQFTILAALSAVALILLAVMVRMGQQAHVNVTLHDYRIEAAPYFVQKGDMVRMVIHNAGQKVHELEVEGYAVEVEDIQPGQTRLLTFRADRAGMFELVCHLDDHEQRGMKAEFRIDQ